MKTEVMLTVLLRLVHVYKNSDTMMIKQLSCNHDLTGSLQLTCTDHEFTTVASSVIQLCGFVVNSSIKPGGSVAMCGHPSMIK